MAYSDKNAPVIGGVYYDVIKDYLLYFLRVK